jgi:hypothetical protein
MLRSKILITHLILLFLCFIMVCQKNENQVLNYFINSELQYETNTQKENIITALYDILNLSEEELKQKKYKNYLGQENQWDLPTLIYKHFVPDKQNKHLGDNFYHDIKSKDVKVEIIKTLDKLNNSNRLN